MNPISGSSGAMQDILALRQRVLEQNQYMQELRQGAANRTSDVDPALAPAPVQESEHAGGFADSLQNALSSVNATQHRAADLSAAYERGEVTDVAQVMLARQEAGLAFEATLQVRNKLMSAYQDIMRMGV